MSPETSGLGAQINEIVAYKQRINSSFHQVKFIPNMWNKYQIIYGEANPCEQENNVASFCSWEVDSEGGGGGKRVVQGRVSCWGVVAEN